MLAIEQGAEVDMQCPDSAPAPVHIHIHIHILYTGLLNLKSANFGNGNQLRN
jgi:hypothetical protein